MAGRVEGKVAFVTGAARGQGRSHAVRLAEEGADIIAIDICDQVATVPYPMSTPEDLAKTVELVEQHDRRIISSIADVRDSAALRKAVDEGVAELGRLDIVVANAGIISPGLIDYVSDDQVWQETIDINLTGVWNTAKVAIPHMRAGARGGSITLISSLVGLRAAPGIVHYVTAKHGVVGMMRALALELAPENIRVNCLAPTQVNTDMIMNEALMKVMVWGEEHPTLEQFAAASQGFNALPIPWVEPLDVSNALLFLVSEEARYITGLALPVDAGGATK